tara:strand:+ start:3960 stop:4616 length:657 start_codon:yes stop_codon:yes gene_type:complete
MLIAIRLFFLFSILFYFNLTVGAQHSPTDSTTYGSVILNFNTDSALTIINNQFREAKMIGSGDTLHLKTGLTSIKLSVIHDFLFEEIFVLKKDSTFSLTHQFKNQPLSKELLDGNYAARNAFGANLLIITDEQSNIVLNNKDIGTGYVFTNGLIGENNLVVSIPKHNSKFNFNTSNEFSNSDLSFKIIEQYVKPDKSRSRKIALIPGASQAYSGGLGS